MDKTQVFEVALDATSGIGWRLARIVTELHPGQFVLDGVMGPFDLVDFARESGRCTITLDAAQHAQLETGWRRHHGSSTRPVNAVYDVAWEGQALRVIVASWRVAYHEIACSLVVAKDEATARAFVDEVCAFCNEPRQAILRFTGGCFSHDRELWRAIARSSFEDLVLAGDLKETIIDDFTSFLGARAEYERYGVSYKRGVLLLGPPGNGKTHCLRALIKMLALPCIYVTSLKSRYSTEDAGIDSVFSRAMEITPCVLVFEDLDAMITNKNRSFFLNKLDGLADASGLVTLATTNHPERLDPAILERPSRFDRKYHFDLPSAPERERYLAMWNARVDAAMRVEPAVLGELVEDTHEFSFAYLKELWVSAMVRWMHEKNAGEMRAHLRGQARVLREQMSRAPAPVIAEDRDHDHDHDDDD
jgi:hypothetical protein